MHRIIECGPVYTGGQGYWTCSCGRSGLGYRDRAEAWEAATQHQQAASEVTDRSPDREKDGTEETPPTANRIRTDALVPLPRPRPRGSASSAPSTGYGLPAT